MRTLSPVLIFCNIYPSAAKNSFLGQNNTPSCLKLECLKHFGINLKIVNGFRDNKFLDDQSAFLWGPSLNALCLVFGSFFNVSHTTEMFMSCCTIWGPLWFVFGIGVAYCLWVTAEECLCYGKICWMSTPVEWDEQAVLMPLSVWPCWDWPGFAWPR